MNEKEIKKYDLQFGDIVLLYSWEELQSLFEQEYDEQKSKPNGNLVAPNGHRSFEHEKELYGQHYKVTSAKDSLHWGTHINCINKRELCCFEIKSVIKRGQNEYNRILKRIKEC